MLNRPPRALAIHDLSGVGRCSLTVALPVLSACGVTCACLPTAVLSTHTGGFQGYTFRDLTEDMTGIKDHWKRENITFEAIYTGYLGSPRQLSIVQSIRRDFGQNPLTLVDPVLGDEGQLYRGLDDQMVKGMRALCAGADVIVPNMTEAALLLGEPYHAGTMNIGTLEKICKELMNLGTKNVVLTGVLPDENHIGAACYDGSHLSLCTTKRVPARFDGTGDVFSSVLLGAMMKQKPLCEAAQFAADFTHDCIALTASRGGDQHYGVDFEDLLYVLKPRLEGKS